MTTSHMPAEQPDELDEELARIADLHRDHPGRPDDLDDEIARVMADPAVQARLAKWEDRKRRGDFAHTSHNEARKIVGLPPLPEYD